MDKIYIDGDYVVIEKEYIDTMDLLHRVKNQRTTTSVIKYTEKDIEKELKLLKESKCNLNYDSAACDAGDDSYFYHLEFLDEQTEFFESLLSYFN